MKGKLQLKMQGQDLTRMIGAGGGGGGGGGEQNPGAVLKQVDGFLSFAFKKQF